MDYGLWIMDFRGKVAEGGVHKGEAYPHYAFLASLVTIHRLIDTYSHTCTLCEADTKCEVMGGQGLHHIHLSALVSICVLVHPASLLASFPFIHPSLRPSIRGQPARSAAYVLLCSNASSALGATCMVRADMKTKKRNERDWIKLTARVMKGREWRERKTRGLDLHLGPPSGGRLNITHTDSCVSSAFLCTLSAGVPSNEVLSRTSAHVHLFLLVPALDLFVGSCFGSFC